MTLTAILMLVVAASSATAQKPGRMPQDPTALTFEASPDHDAVDANGPLVLKYLIDFSPINGLGTAKRVDIGKPTPEAGLIRVSLAPLGLAPGRYMAQVLVLGQTTSTASSLVGPFQLGKPKAQAPEPSEDPSGAPASHPTFWRRLYILIVGQ